MTALSLLRTVEPVTVYVYTQCGYEVLNRFEKKYKNLLFHQYHNLFFSVHFFQLHYPIQSVLEVLN